MSKKINANRKGKDFERWVARWFQENLGTPACRGQQHSGSPDSPDVRDAVPGVHVECKADERLNIHAAMEQSIRDAGPLTPIVIHKRNHKPVLLTCRLEDLVTLAVRVYMALEIENGDSNGEAGSNPLAGHRP